MGAYGEIAIANLKRIERDNSACVARVARSLESTVASGGRLLVFGSGHSSIFAMELYHRAGGPSFVQPVIGEYLLPTAGPPIVRRLERTPGIADVLLARAVPRRGEMLWICSQSGINGATVGLAIAAKKMGLKTVAFTSLTHSRSVPSRHPSGKRLFEVCNETLDLGGVVGDAAVPVGKGRGVSTMAGPLSTLSAVFLAHSVLVEACARLERRGIRCVYTSVNTPAGERRNRALERRAAAQDPLLRE